MMTRTRIRLAQNFLKDPILVRSLIEQSSITEKDTVLEIGPGEGIITAALARVAAKVVAVEKDRALFERLKKDFSSSRIHIHLGDFRTYKIDLEDYVIFSNIPFNQTADILKKILSCPRPPREAYLVVQEEAAQKYMGRPSQTVVSLLASPWYRFDIFHRFARTDFDPAPSVDAVLLHLQQRQRPLVQSQNRELYERFVAYGFGAWKKNLKLAYKKIFTHTQWKKLSVDLGIPLKATPKEVGFDQWLGLFNYLLTGVSSEKKRVLFENR